MLFARKLFRGTRFECASLNNCTECSVIVVERSHQEQWGDGLDMAGLWQEASHHHEIMYPRCPLDHNNLIQLTYCLPSFSHASQLQPFRHTLVPFQLTGLELKCNQADGNWKYINETWTFVNIGTYRFLGSQFFDRDKFFVSQILLVLIMCYLILTLTVLNNIELFSSYDK